MTPPSLFDRRLLVVIGKGGVGRTTASVSLAMAAARGGRRVCVVELYGNAVIAEQFGLGERSYAPRPIADGVDTMSLTPIECLADYARRKIRVPGVVQALSRSRVFNAFINGVPGLHDLFQLGKIHNLVTSPGRNDPRYDVLVVDAPATGHGLTLLHAGRSMREMTRAGRFTDEAGRVEELIDDPTRTGLVLVTLPEELPVNESLELCGGLGTRRNLLAGAVVNGALAHRIPDPPGWAAMREALAGAQPELTALGDRLDSARQREDAAIARFAAGLPGAVGHAVPFARLPRFGPAEITVAEVAELGKILARELREAR